MDLKPYFKSVVEQDRSAVVLCDLEHTMLYLNPAAVKRYAKYGGMALVGRSLLDCHNEASNDLIRRVVVWFQESREHNLIYLYRKEAENREVYMVALRDDDGNLIGYYEKHEYRDRETMKLLDFQP